MRRRLFAIAATIAASCKDEPPPPPPAPVGLELVDQGVEPRTLLHYGVAKGTVTPLEITGDNELGSGSEHTAWPSIVTGSEVAIDDVLPDGTMKVRYTVRSENAIDRPNQLVTAEQMMPPLQLLVGTSIHGTLTPSGVLSDLTVDTGGKILPPALQSEVNALTRGLDRMVMPLPHKPVGVGAVWTFKQALDQTGMKLSAATTIKATAITATTVTFDLTSSISGPDQDTTAAGPKVAVKNIHGTMHGGGTIDLAHLTLAGELVAEITMDMVSGGDTERTTMTTTLRMKPQAPVAPQGAQNAP